MLHLLAVLVLNLFEPELERAWEYRHSACRIAKKIEKEDEHLKRDVREKDGAYD